ncbi:MULTISPECIES: 1-aminocyclopropane-1-carboxylate deaminase/D-cysteine desulfhydrase [unclassified Crossiella]|uniref:1-aminocyclopropane-1-carboxylate deaminase/D-cysteine desulfhydrase n=1 Tax=unclassified Crossiella TaxID=2620835 RepID=UPI001FFF486E|nr:MULTISPECIES: pyridoxal-phosphate dependent enzyme [unclassified Crossiella]MCK2243708.1 pyridoxal-phosphate dependent enzyme [Crossiella sp. S99.2]MCK2257567.1 pyridoxal-phosphate dependent enzyme [Crossiella sp. S99.1]
MSLPDLRLPSPLVELHDERAQRRGVELYLKRDDLIHPELRGNKWRKLQHNITAAKEQGFKRLLTFGGAFSNHVSATAAAGSHFGFETIGVIRGEEHLPLNDTLAQAGGHGMTLTYLDRQTYRNKTDPVVLQRLHEELGDFYLVPEGGSNALALKGCAELPAEITIPFNVICCAVGTGGTLAGIAHGLQQGQRALGFAALKGGDFLNSDVDQLQHDAFGSTSGNWLIETEFHFGGFAKRKPELADFIADFQARHGIQLDWVYVAKMLYGVFTLIDRGRFAPGTRVVAVITG